MSSMDTPSSDGWHGDASAAPETVAAAAADHELTDFIDQATSRIEQEVAQLSAQVSRHVCDLQSLSERETLAIGQVLSTILESVEGILENSEKELRRSTSAVEDITDEFVQHVEKEAEGQQHAVERVFGLADDIGKSLESIDLLRHTTEMLAINSKVEAARLGDQGRPFAILAEQMRDLGLSVKKTTESVNASIESVREGLPQIAQHTNAMNEYMQGYIEDMKQQLQSQQTANLEGQSSGTNLDQVVELSNRALSHLQFQDPLAQRLGAIEREVAGLRDRIGSIVKGDDLPIVSESRDEEDYEESTGGQPASGDIMLF